MFLDLFSLSSALQYCILSHVKLIIWFSDTDFQKNDEGGRVFNFLYLYAYWFNL